MCKVCTLKEFEAYNTHRGTTMLRKFSVENFKNFQTKIVWDLSAPANYEFSQECIDNGIVSKGAIYGINGVGKSNFGRAIFDIVNSLTDKAKELDKYIPFLNLNSKKQYASFEYEFLFDGSVLTYRYQKQDVNTLLEESLSIDGKEMLFYDFRSRSGFSNFPGSENLNLNDNSFISRVKFVMNSAILDESNHDNHVLILFKRFLNGMLLFYSLRENGFIGFHEKGANIEDIIVSAGKTKDFEAFLNRTGLDLTLVDRVSPEGKRIYIKYKNGEVPFFMVASTGMCSLILLYSWLISIDDCSFVFIDEFDAFYHHELARLIVEEFLHHKGIQFFTTTHNTDLMSNDLLRPDTYFILDEHGIKALNHCTERDLRFAHNLQKMYKAGAFTTND